MKLRLGLAVFFSVLLTQAVFGGSMCTNTGTTYVLAATSYALQSYDCNFYREPAVDPFSLTSIQTDPFYPGDGTTLALNLENNWLGIGYVVWVDPIADPSLDITDVAAWKDILFISPNQLCSPCAASDQVYVYWDPAQAGYPALTDITSPANPNLAGQNEVLPWDSVGPQTFTENPNPDTTINFNIFDTTPPGPVPEPSTLLLVIAGGLGTMIVRRRRRGV
jgi:hypothetical protein